MLKNDMASAKKYVEQHAQGKCETPSELERIMFEEAEYLIKRDYDNRAGAQRLYGQLERAGAKKNLLAMTEYDRKIKLNQMERTWEFTRPLSMVFKLIETFFYMLISNT